MLISRFLLVKQFLFCLANFKMFGSRNVSSPVPFVFASKLNNFEKQYRDFSLIKRFLRYVRKISKGSLVNDSPCLVLNVDYLTARLPDVEMAKTLLAVNQQSERSTLSIKKKKKVKCSNLKNHFTSLSTMPQPTLLFLLLFPSHQILTVLMLCFS